MGKISRRYALGVESYVDDQGRLHSPDNDTPARSSFSRNGYPLKEFYRQNQLHRDNDLPAFEGVIEQNKGPTQVTGWFVNGLAHREGDKPSAIEFSFHENLETITYSKNGLLDRDPSIGPASFVLRYSKNKTEFPVIVSSMFFHNGSQLPNLKLDLEVVKIKEGDSFRFDAQVKRDFTEIKPEPEDNPKKKEAEKEEAQVEIPKEPKEPKEPAVTSGKTEEKPVAAKRKGGRPKGSKNKK